MLEQTYNLEEAEAAYGQFLSALGFDWKSNPHMQDTPRRVAKAWVNDLAKGCYEKEPIITI